MIEGRMINDREPIVQKMNEIAKGLREAADRTEMQAKYFARDGHPDTVTSVLNELLWMTPNLGIQATINRLVRELERSND
jgi:hypothetical protein